MISQSVGWHHREPPLPIAGVLAEGQTAAALARRLGAVVAKATDQLDLSVHIAEGIIVALGSEKALPWCDGSVWLGRDDLVLCPTTLRPDLPTDLIVRAVRRSAKSSGAVLITPGRVRVLEGSGTSPTTEELLAFADEIGADK